MICKHCGNRIAPTRWAVFGDGWRHEQGQTQGSMFCPSTTTAEPREETAHAD
jgi:hypothetical protein